MVPLNKNTYFNALCFIEQCLPTRQIPIAHLANACGINLKSDFKELLDYLVEEKVLKRYPPFDTWSRNDSHDCSEIVGIIEVPRWITRTGLRQRSEKIGREHESNEDPPSSLDSLSEMRGDENNMLDKKQSLPRRHQVKVLLNDIELRYLETLIGEVGDDKASIFRNLLHASFQRNVQYECGMQRDREIGMIKVHQPASGESIAQSDDYYTDNLLSELTKLSDEEMVILKTVFDLIFVVLKRRDPDLSLDNINYLHEDNQEQLKAAVRNAARADGDFNIAILGEENISKMQKSMEDVLRGIRLVYEGKIESVRHTVTTSTLIYHFKRG